MRGDMVNIEQLEKLRALNKELVAALRLHDMLARADEKSGDDALWTDNYREACEATRAAIDAAKEWA